MSLLTSDCWIFASDGGYLKIRDTSDWKRQVYCTGTSGIRVVIPTVRSDSSGNEECNPNSQKWLPIQWSCLFQSELSLTLLLLPSKEKIHQSEAERNIFSLILIPLHHLILFVCFIDAEMLLHVHLFIYEGFILKLTLPLSKRSQTIKSWHILIPVQDNYIQKYSPIKKNSE